MGISKTAIDMNNNTDDLFENDKFVLIFVIKKRLLDC